MQEPDYEKLGLKCGIEVHQQLDTGKLFSRTPSELKTEVPEFSIERKLRPVPSELGEYDKTALDAFKRNETYIYQGYRDTISLVEIDCEPPQPIDEEALRTTLEVAALCNSVPFDKIIPMRKTVIDGSNTSGFQRTVLIAAGGEFEINSGPEGKKKRIGVQTIVLEEDAARPIKKEQGKVHYNLDRLGIPLIELATEPDIKTPQEAVDAARKIGELMRLTGRTKRGKGTIRQDVNVSIAQGARCEIKGCQELELLGTVVEKEAQRQLDLIALREKLKEKFPKTGDRRKLFHEPQEISKALANTEAKFAKGKTVYGVKIEKAKGLLGEKVGGKRFGSELSAYAKATGVSGLLHRDELPNYGISEKDVVEISKGLGCKEEDNFVLIVAEKEKAVKAFEAVKERFLTAFEKVPSETRGMLEDGSSEYQRPLSGEARMYPETDVPFRAVDGKEIAAIKKGLPLSAAERKKLYAKWGLGANHVEEMKLSNYARFFEKAVEEGANAKVAAALLLQTLTELKRKGVAAEKVPLTSIKELLLAEAKGKISKNALGEAVEEMAKGAALEEALSAKKTSAIDKKAIEKIIAGVVSKNSAMAREKGLGAMGPLMGDLMKEPALKGVDGKTLSELLRKEIQAHK